MPADSQHFNLLVAALKAAANAKPEPVASDPAALSATDLTSAESRNLAEADKDED